MVAWDLPGSHHGPSFPTYTYHSLQYIHLDVQQFLPYNPYSMTMLLLDVHARRTFLSLSDPNSIEMQIATNHILPGTSVPRLDRVDAFD